MPIGLFQDTDGCPTYVSAFTLTAETIRKVGEQSYVTSLLRTEENAALLEDAQRALTELITILSVWPSRLLSALKLLTL